MRSLKWQTLVFFFLKGNRIVFFCFTVLCFRCNGVIYFLLFLIFLHIYNFLILYDAWVASPQECRLSMLLNFSSIENTCFIAGNGMTVTNHRDQQKALCTGCAQPIEDRFYLEVMGNSWHEHCLQCCVCQQPLTDKCHVKDRKFFCKLDYEK